MCCVSCLSAVWTAVRRFFYIRIFCVPFLLRFVYFLLVVYLFFYCHKCLSFLISGGRFIYNFFFFFFFFFSSFGLSIYSFILAQYVCPLLVLTYVVWVCARGANRVSYGNGLHDGLVVSVKRRINFLYICARYVHKNTKYAHIDRLIICDRSWPLHIFVVGYS